MHKPAKRCRALPYTRERAKKKNSFLGEGTEGLGEPGRAGVVLPPSRISRTPNYTVYKVYNP